MGFIILLIIIFVVIPYLLRPLLVWYLRRRARNYFDDAFGFSSRFHQEEPQRKAGWSKPAERKKKIGRDEGEYVRFEEIKIDRTSSADSSKETKTERVVVEQQIVDIEWEDIK